jgi:hypothetical protein
VWISVLLHGITAAPGARLDARPVARMGACAETKRVATERAMAKSLAL